MTQNSWEKIGFVASVVFLSFLYGYGARTFGWFPSNQLESALRQAYRVASPPLYLFPAVYERSGTKTIEEGAVQPGVTLLVSRWEQFGWNPGLRLIDNDGRTLHEWHLDPERFLEGGASQNMGYPIGGIEERSIHGSHLLPNGDVVANLDYVGTVRLDACSRVRWLLAAGTHHSITRSEDGTFWIPASSRVPRSATPAFPEGLPGIEQPVFLDWILHVSPDGAVLDSLNVLDLLYENGLERHIFKSGLTDTTDITHLNDVEPLSTTRAADFPGFDAGDLLLSLRNLDLVLVVDPRSRQVKWHEQHPFIMQHDPDFLRGGWIGVFDNNSDGSRRGGILGGSRIVAIRPASDSLRVLFPTFRSDPFHTHMMGKWQLLENGNLLLTESRAGRVVEVDPDGRTLWEWIAEPYDESMVPEVTEGTRYALSQEDVASWPCGAP